MNFSRLLTWLDVKRVIQEKTVGGRQLPEGISRIGCYSDALEIGVRKEEQLEDAGGLLKEWFGEWYQEAASCIQLDFDNAVLPVEFLVGEEGRRTDISPRPFWEEMAYLAREPEDEAENPVSSKLPELFPDDSPELISFYSFKGGVGRTLHLAAFLFALLDRAKELGKPATVLVIDADLEAPGLTYWNRREKQQPSVSFLDFLELYQYAPLDSEEKLALFAEKVKKFPKKDGGSTWYFLPACLEDTRLLDTPVLPEHLARNPNGWECGDAVRRLGQAVGADYVLLDLRAGLSEVSSPLLFDPRMQRYLITTLTEQSVTGTSLVLDQISRLAPQESEPPDGKIGYYDPSLIISMLKAEFKSLPDFEDALVRLRSAYIEADEDTVYAKRLQIFETDFAEELLYINGWEDARSKLASTSVMRTAEEWAGSQLKFSERKSGGSERPDNEETQFKAACRLRKICRQYEFAENGQGRSLLVTESLKNLATAFSDELPRAVSIGAKGAGKTFNYIQLSQFGFWEKFVNHVLKKSSEEANTKTYIFPLLQSNGLKDEADKITQNARDSVKRSLDNNTLDFSHSQCQDRIKLTLSNEDLSELDWIDFWGKELLRALGMEPDDSHQNRLADLNTRLKARDIKIIFLFDGLEDIFADVSSNKAQQTALKALIDLPKRLSEIRQANTGLIIFLRRDFVRYVVTQNSAQFENLYRAYDLAWDKDSFRKLVFWICSQASILDAEEEELESLSRDELSARLEQLWGLKLGSDTSREAYTVNWVFAALTDLKGRLQARDIVRLLLHAADITVENAKEVMLEKWSVSRILPPQAIRRAIEPCSREKVKEAMEEYPEFRKWVEQIRRMYPDRKIPFTREQFAMDQAVVDTLEEMGVIYEDRGKDGASLFYMPEIFRAGLEFSLEKGARPRVLVLKRKALGAKG